MKKSKRRAIVRKLDKLWAEIVKIRAGYRCQRCGKKSNNLQAHHICGRRKYSTRWVIENGVALCAACHILVQENFVEASELVKKVLEKEVYEALKKRAEMVIKYTTNELEELLQMLEERRKRYG